MSHDLSHENVTWNCFIMVTVSLDCVHCRQDQSINQDKTRGRHKLQITEMETKCENRMINKFILLASSKAVQYLAILTL